MRKEIFFAIFAGILFGLVVAFGALRANTAIKNSNQEISTQKDDVAQNVLDSDATITIAKPENFDIIDSDNVVISGISTPGTNILISGENDDYLLTTDESGAFEKEVELQTSFNSVFVASYSNDGLGESQNIQLVYSSEFFKQLNPPNGEDATQSADLTEQNVERKLDLAANKPKFVSGTITDITNETLQIKNDTSEIQQVSIGDNTSYVDNKKTSKDITFDDIAIGDYVLCLGFSSGDSVLSANRVLVSNKPNDENKNIFVGSFVNISSKIATFTANGDEFTVDFPKRWNGPEIDELNDGENYLVVAINNDGKYYIRTIQPTSLTTPTPTP